MENIAYIIDRLQIGGTEKHLAELYVSSVKSNAEPMMITLRDNDKAFLDSYNLSPFVIGIWKLLSFSSVNKCFALANILRKKKIKIVHAYFFDSAVIAFLVKIILVLYGYRLSLVTSRRDLGFWYTKTIVSVLRIINIFTDAVVVNSKSIKEFVEKVENLESGKVHVVYNGIDVQRFQIQPAVDPMTRWERGRYVVGIVANLNRPVKRVDVLIRSIPAVVQRCPGTTFVVVGDGHLRESLHALAVELHVEQYVEFKGRVVDVPSVLAEFDIGVLTSDSEGFSNAIIEYLAGGVPVVAVDSGGTSEVIEDGVNGYLIQPGDYGELANRICEILLDKENFARLRCNTKQVLLQRYSLERQLAGFNQVYSSLSR